MSTDFSSPAPAPGTNKLAIVSVILSLAGVPFLCFSVASPVISFCSCFAGVLALAGLVTGFIARQQIKSTDQEGDSMALTGMIVGGGQVVLVICGLTFVVVLYAAGMMDQVIPNTSGILK